MDKKKGSRQSQNHNKYRTKKKIPPKNKYDAEKSDLNISASAKKLKSAEEIFVPEEPSIGYRILNFFTVFSTLSEHVCCKTCGGDLKFLPDSTRGLGFKIVVLCSKCQPTSIPSCPYVNKTSYEINQRFFFAMRLLGVGLYGAKKFCGIMDLPAPLQQNTYDLIMKNIHAAVSCVCNAVMKQAVSEEREEIKKHYPDGNDAELTVSGDGTWRKRGFTSLFGIAVLICHYTGKVVDFIVKSSVCSSCSYWSKHTNSEQYEEWKSAHEENCKANHEGSSGKMEVDAMKEIFSRSVEKYGVRYVNYIGDGDSKTYTGIVNSKPYGEECEIIKKECVGHVQKRMGTRLRACKKSNPGIGGRNKLTAKMIDKLSVYYGLAIRRHCDSKDDMKKAIWATYYHYSSTDDNPQHQFCPEGAESWCKWQKSKAAGTLRDFTHDYLALPKIVLDAIKPIYDDLSGEKLLERCVGGYTQNCNESYNQLVWKMAPKTSHSGATVVEIAALLATCLFNNGTTSFLQVMNTMGMAVGPNAHAYAAAEDNRRIALAEVRAQESSKEGRLRRRQDNLENLNILDNPENIYYGPGMDDSM